VRPSLDVRPSTGAVMLALSLVGLPGFALGADATAELTTHQENSGWLAWSAPPECPSSEDIAAQVRKWIHGEIPPPEELRIEATATSSGAAWKVHIVVNDSGVRGERHVSTATCSDAAELVAIAAALAIAPGEVSTLRTEPTRVQAPEEPPKTASGAPETGLNTETALPRSVPERRAKAPPQWGWAAGASVLLGTGLLPGMRGGLALHGAMVVGRVDVALSALGFPAVASPAGEAAPVDLAALGGGASLAYLWGGPDTTFGPSLGLEAGAVVADQEGEGTRRSPTGTPWLAVLAGGRVRLRLHKSLKTALGADLFLPLVRPNLYLDNGAPVHQVDVGVRGLLEVSFRSHLGE
jgi:hypothetical protein